MLAKTAGVKHLVVLINKMDDPTVRILLLLIQPSEDVLEFILSNAVNF